MEHQRTSQPAQHEQVGVKIEGDASNQDDAVIETHTIADESNENQSIEIRAQNVIMSNSEGKTRPQDGSEDVQNSSVEGESSVGQIE